MASLGVARWPGLPRKPMHQALVALQPTTSEYLAEEGMQVDHETLRRWRLAQGKPRMRHPRQRHRQWRERKPCFEAMVQLDGSHHDRFEGRGDEIR